MDLIYNTLKSLAYVITEPYYLVILVVLGVILYFKNNKTVLMNNMIIGENNHTSLELTLSQIVIGIFAGILASILLTITGVMFTEQSGIQILFVISVLLAFIKPRYICFSYSGAILGLISIIIEIINKNGNFGKYTINIDIAMLMTFVAILHIVEAALVAFDGDRGAIPVFSDRKGTIIGGYALKRNWVVPIAVFIAYFSNTLGDATSESIKTPSWWPLISTMSTSDILNTMAVLSMPFWCIIGYSSVTFTKRKKQKSLQSALYIFAFGVILLIVSQVANYGIVGRIFVVIFAPLAHEAMLKFQSIMEGKNQPKFVSDDSGFCVLDVVKESKAYQMGFRPQDKIKLINNEIVESEVQIYKMIKIKGTDFKVINYKGIESNIIVNESTKNRMGILIVPKKVDSNKTVAINKNSFSDVLNKLKNKH